MKKFAAVLLAAVLTLGTIAPVNAEAADTKVYVTIVNGDVKLAQQEIKVTDVDKDGALTINDALYLAHEEKYTGGAEAGYGSAMGQWGLSLTKLWGVENGGSYGYYVNNASAMGLGDPVKNGDFINAFVYTDTVGFSDTYSYFDKATVSYRKGSEVTLTLSGAGYDANWNPVTVPVANATVTVDGVKTNVKTDANGKATVKLDASKSCVISAVSDTTTLVAPVCVATVAVNDRTPKTGDNTVRVMGVLMMIGLAGMGYFMGTRKKAYDK